jgi:hypothetical protein
LCYNQHLLYEHVIGRTMDKAQANLEVGTQARPAFPLERDEVRRNHRLGVLNGTFIELAMALTNPGMVLTVLVRELE